MTKPGPTGDYPDGKLNADDEGGIAVAIAYDPNNDTVHIDFGKPVAWIALPPSQAVAFAELIIHHALRGKNG